MEDEDIFFYPKGRQWWYNMPLKQVKMMRPARFLRQCQRVARVFSIEAIEDFTPFPDEYPSSTKGKDEVPTEFRLYADVFNAANAAILPHHKATDHNIELQEGKEPPYGPIYPLSPAELAQLREYLDENLKNGRIRPSKSPAGAPILFVPKQDGTLRLCVDYRGLNHLTVKNRYPLPLMSEIMDRINGCKFLTKIDVKDAYYRIRIREGDEWKTAFRTRYGHFEYLVMPFGLTNAPATFQHYIHQALRGLLDTVCIAYLDDILIFSKDRDTHTAHVKEVLERMREAELYAKPSKCVFYQQSVEFLGFILSTEGVSMDPRRVQTIREWKEPTSYHEIQVFLGFCNFYRRFIYGYSRVTAPLTELLKGSKDGKKPGNLVLPVKAKQAFRALIEAFQSAPLLRHFDQTRPIRVETDASNFAMAGILSQPDEEGRWHPIAFWSRKFNGTEVGYGTPDKEMFAIVESFKHWRHYLEGPEKPVEVLSDHHNLQGFMKQPRLNGRQARWCMLLAPYDFVIKHRPGNRNPADGPSRRPDYAGETPSNLDLLPTLARKMAAVESLRVTAAGLYIATEAQVGSIRCRALTKGAQEESLTQNKGGAAETRPIPLVQASSETSLPREQYITRAQARQAAKDEDIYAPVISISLVGMIREAQKADETSEAFKRGDKHTKSGRLPDGYMINPEGLLCFKDRLVVPEEAALRHEIMRIYHDDPLAGHFGGNRTRELISRKFFWPGMDVQIREYVRECPVCQGMVTKRHRPYGALEPLPIPSRPWSQISMDFITGLPVNMRRHDEVDMIFVVVDRYTKYSLFFAVPSTITAVELAELFHTEVELRYGPPEGIVSDRGSLFTSNFWAEVQYLSRIKLRLSTAFHPQTDGQTERMNQTLEYYLRCFIDENQANWANLLKTAQFACNNAINASTRISPNKALFGYEPNFQVRDEDVTVGGRVPEAEARVRKLEEVRSQLAEQWRKANETQSLYYNKKHQPITFARKQLVMLSTKNLRLKGEKRKLAPRRVGPFKVLEKIGKQAYRLALPEKYSRIHNVFHVSLLEPWHPQKEERNSAETMPFPDLEDEDNQWELEEVRDKQTQQGEAYYLVKWKGWPSEYNQWVTEEDMANATAAIRKYEKAQAKKRKQLQSAEKG
jgi:transposase InsO family protein